MRRLLTLFTCILLSVISVVAKTVYDTANDNIASLFKHGKAKYVLRYHHQFADTLFVPKGSEIVFEGGALSGPIFFSNTLLRGAVNLKGSSVSGRIRNKQFNASWLCAMDGVTDDAPRINEMIEVCGNVYFPKGEYRLITAFNPKGKLPNELHASVEGHIAIDKDNVTLMGEIGTTFVTDQPLITLCVFSQPYQIEHSVSNIKVEGIIFEVKNDGVNFHEFVHTIKIMGVNGISIKNCVFKDFWGDAICLSHYGDNPQTRERTRNQNVRILNNAIVGGEHHSNRNGISIINGQNVIIQGNTIKNTSRKDMPGGIDIEPNNSVYTIENIRILNNVIELVRTNAIQVYIPNGSPAHRIEIKDNTIKACGNGLYIGIHSDGTTDNFRILHNTFDNNTNPYYFGGEAQSANWVIRDNIFDRPCKQDIPGDIRVTNLVLRNNKKKQ